MKRIFVSHPLHSEGTPYENIMNADDICRGILSDGLLPISPLHSFGFVGKETPETRAAIMEWCKEMILHCDELWYYGIKGGCAEEIRRAEQNRIPVVDRRGQCP